MDPAVPFGGLQDERLRARGHLQQMEEYLSVKAV